MVAFILPITWALTGAASLGLLYRVSSFLGFMGLAADNWRLRRCVSLGLEPAALGLSLDAESARDLIAEELGIARRAKYKHVFELSVEDIPEYPWLAGTYALVAEEESQFLDGVRHLMLLDGIGPEAERLKELIKGTNIKYEDLSFLWEGFGCDFAKLQKLSRRRLEDFGFRMLANLPPS